MKLKLRPLRIHGLEMKFSGKTLHYASTQDFEFAIGPRAEISDSRLRRILAMNATERHESAIRLREFEREVIDALAASPRDPAVLQRMVNEWRTEQVEDIGEWHALLQALCASTPSPEYLRVALVNLLRCLAATLGALESLTVAGGRSLSVTRQMPRGAEASLPQTGARFVPRRLPPGRATLLPIPEDGVLALVISRYPCTVCAGPRATFAIGRDSPRPLEHGPNIIGRDRSCDIVLPARYRDVSRRHLLVDLSPSASVALTDLSTHGSYLLEPVRT